jgi:hypothetical protein
MEEWRDGKAAGRQTLGLRRDHVIRFIHNACDIEVPRLGPAEMANRKAAVPLLMSDAETATVQNISRFVR